MAQILFLHLPEGSPERLKHWAAVLTELNSREHGTRTRTLYKGFVVLAQGPSWGASLVPWLC